LTTGALRGGVGARTGFAAVADVTGAAAEARGTGALGALALGVGAAALTGGAAEAEGAAEALGSGVGGVGELASERLRTTTIPTPITTARRPRTATTSAAVRFAGFGAACSPSITGCPVLIDCGVGAAIPDENPPDAN
jgi:hypothetical protein